MNGRQPTRLEMAVMIVTSMITTGAAVWTEMSPAQRQMALLTIRAAAWKTAHRLAGRAGRAGMGGELAGRHDTAHAGYTLAYRLSVLRDRL